MMQVYAMIVNKSLKSKLKKEIHPRNLLCMAITLNSYSRVQNNSCKLLM